MVDYSYFCVEHFAPSVKLLSQFIVTSACFDKGSSELEYSRGKDGHLLFLNINIAHCAAKGIEVHYSFATFT